jgi:hypothetical protein
VNNSNHPRFKKHGAIDLLEHGAIEQVDPRNPQAGSLGYIDSCSQQDLQDWEILALLAFG